MIWRNACVTTFPERDPPNPGIDFAAGAMRRFWMMAENVRVASLRALAQESRDAIRIRPRQGNRTVRGA